MSGAVLSVTIIAILGIVTIVISICVLADRLHARNPQSKLTIVDTGRAIGVVLSVIIQAVLEILTGRS